MFVLNYHGHKKVMFWNRLRWLPTILAQQKYNEKCQENSTIGNLSGEGFTFRCNWYWKSTVVLMNYRQDTDKREEWSLAWIEGGKLPFVVCRSRLFRSKVRPDAWCVLCPSLYLRRITRRTTNVYSSSSRWIMRP